MTDLEFSVYRSVIARQVLDSLITVVGNAMPHTQPQLNEILRAWNQAEDELEAELRAVAQESAAPAHAAERQGSGEAG